MHYMAHQWVPPHGPIRWEHCGVCGVVRRHDGLNGPCGGPVRIAPRDSLRERIKRAQPNDGIVRLTRREG